MEAETRFEKSLVVHAIIDSIHQIGGRFLKKDFDGNVWFEMTRQQCKEKVGHAIRDAVNSYEARRKKKEKHHPHHIGGGGGAGMPLSTSSTSLLHKSSSSSSTNSSSQLSTPAVRMSIAGLSSSRHSLPAGGGSNTSLSGWKRQHRSPPDEPHPGSSGGVNLTVDTDYGASARKRRRRSDYSTNSRESIMRSAIPLKPSPIQSANVSNSVPQQHSASVGNMVVQSSPAPLNAMDNHPTLTYSSETSADYQQHQQRGRTSTTNNPTTITGPHHFSFETTTTTTNATPRHNSNRKQQRDDYPQIDIDIDMNMGGDAAFHRSAAADAEHHEDHDPVVDDHGNGTHSQHRRRDNADHFELAIEAVLGPMPSRDEDPSP
jgi:hypothetical protein